MKPAENAGTDRQIVSGDGSMAAASRTPGLKRVIIYVGSDPKRDGSMFFLNLFWCLMTLGQKAGMEMIPIIDLRAPSQGLLPPPELARIRAQGEVDGLIAFMVYPTMTEWMRESGLPWTALCEGKNAHFIGFDYTQMISTGFKRLAELGCASAGLMVPAGFTDAAFLEQVDSISEAVGIQVNYEWILASRQSQELSGYEHLCALWQMSYRPKGLLVFPDLAARGVVSALLEKRVRVPDDLRLILHRNAESPYVVPMPCDWLEVSVDGVAKALIKNLQGHWSGGAMGQIKLTFQLVKGEV